MPDEMTSSWVTDERADRQVIEQAAAQLRRGAILAGYAGMEHKHVAFALALVLDELARHVRDLDERLRAHVLDWCQLFSAILSFLALGLASFAIWKANRDLAKERRIAHELEVLRDLSIAIAGQVPNLGALRTTLLMLPGGSDLSTLRAAIGANPLQGVVTAFDSKYAESLSTWPGDRLGPDETKRYRAGLCSNDVVEPRTARDPCVTSTGRATAVAADHRPHNGQHDRPDSGPENPTRPEPRHPPPSQAWSTRRPSWGTCPISAAQQAREMFPES